MKHYFTSPQAVLSFHQAYNLNILHNAVAKVMFESIINVNTAKKIIKEPEPITISGSLEIWWDRPSLYGDKKTSLCTVIDLSVPLDLNTTNKNQDKRNDYVLLVGELQTLYPSFEYQIVPVAIEAFGIVTTELKKIYKHWDSVNPRMDRSSDLYRRKHLSDRRRYAKLF